MKEYEGDPVYDLMDMGEKVGMLRRALEEIRTVTNDPTAYRIAGEVLGLD